MEEKIKELMEKARADPMIGRKANILTQIGDIRANNYIETKDPRERKLAANCYIAATYLHREFRELGSNFRDSYLLRSRREIK